MTKSNTGRPRTYSLEQLDAMLLQYVQQNPNIEVTFVGLEKATGISRNTWARNMRDKIEKINKPLPILPISDVPDNLPLPNVAELVLNLYPNKDKLIEALYQVNKSLHKFYEQAKRAYQLENENEEMAELIKKLKLQAAVDKETIRSLKDQAEYYNQLYRNIVATSTYSSSGLKNVLEFKKGDPKNKDRISADLINQFEMFKPK